MNVSDLLGRYRLGQPVAEHDNVEGLFLQHRLSLVARTARDGGAGPFQDFISSRQKTGVFADQNDASRDLPQYVV